MAKGEEAGPSTQPYSLTVQVEPHPALTCQWTQQFTGTANIPPANIPGPYIKGDETLILWNYSRMSQTYGKDAADTLSGALKLLADTVTGTLVSVEKKQAVRDAYQNWNQNYCDVHKANDVAQVIKDGVTSHIYSDTKYIVLVGSDEMIPFYRNPDATLIANEMTFAEDSQLNTGAILASMAQGFMLTDNFYGVKDQGLLARGRSLWVPKKAVGRLVESPDDIETMIASFLVSDTIPIDDVLITGYDFLTDSAHLISDTVASWRKSGVPFTQTTLINEDWTVITLTNKWPNYAPGRDLVSVNAHFEPWRALPAYPSENYTGADLFYNSHITNSNAISDSLIFSMGCHSGLNLPDGDVNPVYIDKQGITYTISPDFPQALANKASPMVANTGYGYGVDDAPEYTEWLMHLYARFLGSQYEEDDIDMPIGEALRLAKKRYIGSAPSGGLSVYHEKVLLEATLYGLPMQKVHVPQLNSVSNRNISGKFDSPQQGYPRHTDATPIYITATVTLTPARRNVISGSYFHLDNEIQGSPGRPIQPRATLPISDSIANGLTPHGAVLWSGVFTNYSGFDPLITRPVTDTALSQPALQVGGWFPTKAWGINRFGEENNLVLVGGQFKKSMQEEPARSVNSDSGLERIYTQMQLHLYYSASDDYQSPTIWQFQVTQFAGQRVGLRANVEDASGIQGVVVTYCPGDEFNCAGDGVAQLRSVELEPGPNVDDEGNGVWNAVIEDDIPTGIYIQAVDRAGNVQMGGNKGLLFTPKTNSIYLPIVLKQ